MNLNIQRFWKKRSVTITEYDPTYKVVYLGNVLTAWAKGEGCVEKPLATLWKNYCQNVKPDVAMKVTVGNSGLKAVTKEHGLTEYWSNRVTYCAAHTHYPRVFCWVYRHEGKRLRQELRCHAVLCRKEEQARRMASQLQNKLALALQEFKREKICRQNARLSLANCVYDNPSLPRRKILLSTGSINYRPPLERSKTAPKLMVIEEAGELRHQRESPFQKRGNRRRQTYPPSCGNTSFEEFGIIKEEEDDDSGEGIISLDELEDEVMTGNSYDTGGIIGPRRGMAHASSNRDEPYRNFLLREHYQLQQRRQRLQQLAPSVNHHASVVDQYGDRVDDDQDEGEVDSRNDNDCGTELDEVRLLLEGTDMTSSNDRLNENDVDEELLLEDGEELDETVAALADNYDTVAAETFTCNPRAGSAGSGSTDSADQRHVISRGGSTSDNDNDGFISTSPSSSSPSSTNSSPLSSVRREQSTPDGAADESDESGYSEDNLHSTANQHRHSTVTRTFTCDI